VEANQPENQKRICRKTSAKERLQNYGKEIRTSSIVRKGRLGENDQGAIHGRSEHDYRPNGYRSNPSCDRGSSPSSPRGRTGLIAGKKTARKVTRSGRFAIGINLTPKGGKLLTGSLSYECISSITQQQGRGKDTAFRWRGKKKGKGSSEKGYKGRKLNGPDSNSTLKDFQGRRCFQQCTMQDSGRCPRKERSGGEPSENLTGDAGVIF